MASHVRLYTTLCVWYPISLRSSTVWSRIDPLSAQWPIGESGSTLASSPSILHTVFITCLIIPSGNTTTRYCLVLPRILLYTTLSSNFSWWKLVSVSFLPHLEHDMSGGDIFLHFSGKLPESSQPYTNLFLPRILNHKPHLISVLELRRSENNHSW